ncbi:alpha/beta-hydrolase [Metschnikowia bicuspidata var. bicuspidata NRRL YB-4993]|uniref:Alpha/beta-hydrolase n=1 Tax=Metschnikowia bicuspidata var. bicuspidata NRRL YB-4993 TaxID=869754 RepID=A0A1A0HJ78_9ASCO|nr:alpha/beta-hydrolase [Metschnikowia bicuspidata var. bicuspidata NRRL YB-4993]OBA24070.1 alpha/beta-hydrolase [Metschnikowia bicuspidata var. bicuspidata NRRL YB-4993]
MALSDYTIIDSFVVDGLLNQRVQFLVPLDHKNPSNGENITICANITQKFKSKIHKNHSESIVFPTERKLLAYLQGGPGFPCAVPVSNSSYTRVLVDEGYQLVFYDQRGTGLSSPIETDLLIGKMSSVQNRNLSRTENLLLYVLHFRADSIVEDMEYVRRVLIGNAKWSLLGQSFGGFCSFTYLSRYPQSLEEVYVTGGVPPIGFTADDVYRQTYERTKERNAHYYQKYPQDVVRVRHIAAYLHENRVKLPSGGTLSVERFQQLGIRFGAAGGTDGLHAIITEMWAALENSGKPTYAVLHRIEKDTSFDTNVLYALFQEAIYCDGSNKSGSQKSAWAADRLRYAPGNENFVANEDILETNRPIYFTGEMVYKSMYEDYKELVPLKELAHALHENEVWSDLYNVEVLQKIQWEDVPIVAATYYYDQYVDFDLTMRVKKQVFQNNGNYNLRQYITSEFFHNGLRANPAKVLGSMFQLRKREID